MNSKALNFKFILKIFAIFFLTCSVNSNAQDEGKICKSIKKLIVSGEFKKYSVPVNQPELDTLEYTFFANKKSSKIKAYCGNGSDATCEMTLIQEGKDIFTFSLPITIRLIEIRNKIYIINGIIIYPDSTVEAKDYQVHELFSNRIKLLCSKF